MSCHAAIITVKVGGRRACQLLPPSAAWPREGHWLAECHCQCLQAPPHCLPPSVACHCHKASSQLSAQPACLAACHHHTCFRSLPASACHRHVINRNIFKSSQCRHVARFHVVIPSHRHCPSHAMLPPPPTEHPHWLAGHCLQVTVTHCLSPLCSPLPSTSLHTAEGMPNQIHE